LIDMFAVVELFWLWHS